MIDIPASLNEIMPPRSINLDPVDWHWANWRERIPLTRPAPQPFDVEAAREQAKYYLSRDIVSEFNPTALDPRYDLPVVMTTVEACYWFEMMTAVADFNMNDVANVIHNLPKRTLTNTLNGLQEVFQNSYEKIKENFRRAETVTTPPSLDEVRAKLARCAPDLTPAVVVPLYNLFGTETLLDLIFDKDKYPDIYTSSLVGQLGLAMGGAQYMQDHLFQVLLLGFQAYVLPYLDEADLEPLRAKIRPHLDVKLWLGVVNGSLPAEFFLAARVGLPDVMRVLVNSWPDDAFPPDQYFRHFHFRPQEIIMGLDNPQEVQTHMRRLKLTLQTGPQMRGWLAHTEYSGLDLIRASVDLLGYKDGTTELTEHFSLVKAPEAAPHMLDIMLNTKADKVARQWLDDNPEHAIAGLLAALPGRGNLVEGAITYLNRMRGKGYGDTIAAYSEHFPQAVRDKVHERILFAHETTAPPFDDTTTPDWLKAVLPAPSKVNRIKLPDWANPQILPPIMVNGNRLNETQVRALVSEIKKVKIDMTPPALVSALKAHATASSLDGFAWRLFEMWQAEGAAAKDKWGLFALGLLGGDASVLRLAKLIRAWPGEGNQSRATWGVACLRAIGSDTALMQLFDIAQKSRSHTLQKNAQDAVDAWAKARNLTQDQLEDRIIPTCGLDTHGSRTFDFGPRQFQFMLGPDLKPAVRDDKGKIRANLPKPNQKDEADLAAQAQSNWKVFKQQVRQVLKIQTDRLRRGFSQGREWTLAEFETYLLRHPLMVNLVRRILWSGYDADGTQHLTFRITEDLTLANVDEDEVTLEGIAAVMMVHPMELSAADRAAWTEVFSDYEIMQPFPQLAREIYHLPTEDHATTAITRYTQTSLTGVAFQRILEGRGWQHGISVDDYNGLTSHIKPVARANVTIRLEHDNVWGNWGAYTDDAVTIKRCYFVPGLHQNGNTIKPEEALPLGDVDPVTMSETLRELVLLTEKGR